MGRLGRGISGIRKFLWANHKVLSANNSRCYTTDPDKRWELCPDLTCSKGNKLVNLGRCVSYLQNLKL